MKKTYAVIAVAILALIGGIVLYENSNDLNTSIQETHHHYKVFANESIAVSEKQK